MLSFYRKNGSKFLFQSENDEYAYMHSHEVSNEQAVKLDTRLMYCDLLSEVL